MKQLGKKQLAVLDNLFAGDDEQAVGIITCLSRYQGGIMRKC